MWVWDHKELTWQCGWGHCWSVLILKAVWWHFCVVCSALSVLGSSHWHLPYTSFCSIYAKATNIYRQFTLDKNICYHYTNEIYLIVPSVFVMTARPQCALWSRAANSFLARYAGGLYEFVFEAYLRIKFWKFSNSDVLLKLNIYKILVYDAYHICGVRRLVRSQPSPIPSSYSN
jgi:hypothetical protein